MDHELRELALVCLAHLEREEALLVNTTEALKVLRFALRHGDLSAIQEAIREQERTARISKEIQAARERLRDSMGRWLRIPPEQVTLHKIAFHLPVEQGQRLLQRRTRLQALARDVEQLHHANAALIHHFLNFFGQLLTDLTGSPAAGPSYDAAGRRALTHYGSLIEARG